MDHPKPCCWGVRVPEERKGGREREREEKEKGKGKGKEKEKEKEKERDKKTGIKG